MYSLSAMYGVHSLAAMCDVRSLAAYMMHINQTQVSPRASLSNAETDLPVELCCLACTDGSHLCFCQICPVALSLPCAQVPISSALKSTQQADACCKSNYAVVMAFIDTEAHKPVLDPQHATVLLSPNVQCRGSNLLGITGRPLAEQAVPLCALSGSNPW